MNGRRTGSHTVFVVGMAGSGKSVLTSALRETFVARDQNVVTLNLDPGADSLPYSPDIDVRSYVDLYKIMEENQLGPNGALVLASDLIGDHLEEIRGEIEEVDPDLLLADTPGQVELFAFRESGPYFCRSISDEPKAVLYLFESKFSLNPLNFVANAFIAVAVHNRLLLPQVYAISKADLVSESELEKILSWCEDVKLLEGALRTSIGKEISQISLEMVSSIWRAGMMFEMFPISSKLGTGLVELNAALNRILAGGEESTQR